MRVCQKRWLIQWIVALGWVAVATMAQAKATKVEKLHQAVEANDEAAVKEALKSRVKINGKTKEGNTALHLAAKGGRCQILALLLKHKASHQVANNEGMTALMLATEWGHEACVKALISSGADAAAVNSQDGMTVLMYAAYRGHDTLVSILVKAGAKVDAQAKDKDAALHKAASNGHLATVEALIKVGADVKILDKYSRTPTDCANAQYRHFKKSKDKDSEKKYKRIVDRLQRAAAKKR